MVSRPRRLCLKGVIFMTEKNTSVFIPDKYYYPFAVAPYIYEDKEMSLNYYTRYTLNRTLSMFKYTNLPDSIPQTELELYLQVNTHCIIAEVDGVLYALKGGFGGEPDAYYRPTKYIIANPYLNLNKTYTINKDCILCRNDPLFTGLMPLISRYCTMQVENDLSMKLAIINTRIQRFITAGDNIQKQACEKFLKDIVGGKIGVVLMNEFLEGIKTVDYNTTGSTNGTITDLIEMQQYLKASLYNDLGLNANYNMKRESINAHEAQLNNDSLLPFVDQMLRQREIFVEKVNEMFNTQITVELDSSWELRDEYNEMALDQEFTENDSETENENEKDSTDEPQKERELKEGESDAQKEIVD